VPRDGLEDLVSHWGGGLLEGEVQQSAVELVLGELGEGLKVKVPVHREALQLKELARLVQVLVDVGWSAQWEEGEHLFFLSLQFLLEGAKGSKKKKKMPYAWK
jgi:hypothetical protein